MNYLIDLNIIFDYYNNERRELFPHSIEVIEDLLQNDSYNVYISSSSIDNLEFTKAQELKRTFGFASKIVLKKFIEDILSKFKTAKIPSYLEIDYDDIEDSQIIASAKAVNAKQIPAALKILNSDYPDINYINDPKALSALITLESDTA